MHVSCCRAQIYVGQIQVRPKQFVGQDTYSGPGEVGLKIIIEKDLNKLTNPTPTPFLKSVSHIKKLFFLGHLILRPRKSVR